MRGDRQREVFLRNLFGGIRDAEGKVATARVKDQENGDWQGRPKEAVNWNKNSLDLLDPTSHAATVLSAIIALLLRPGSFVGPWETHAEFFIKLNTSLLSTSRSDHNSALRKRCDGQRHTSGRDAPRQSAAVIEQAAAAQRRCASRRWSYIASRRPRASMISWSRCTPTGTRSLSWLWPPASFRLPPAPLAPLVRSTPSQRAGYPDGHFSAPQSHPNSTAAAAPAVARAPGAVNPIARTPSAR